MSDDRLNCTLEVTVGSTSHKFPSGAVRAFDLDLTAWGIRGTIDVVVEDLTKSGGKADPFLGDFLKSDLTAVSLSIQTALSDVNKTDKPKALTVGGFVAAKKLLGRSFQKVSGVPVLERRYRLEFVDPMQLLWRQHRPCELFTGSKATMKSVLEAYKGDKITLSYDWDSLTTEAPMIFVGLDPNQTPATFYDFVAWYLDTRRGLMTFDHAKQAYKFSSAKSSDGTAIAIFSDEVESVSASVGAPPRHQPVVLNSWTNGATKETVTAKDSATGIRHDHLLRTPITDDITSRKTIETSRLQTPVTTLDVAYNRFPTLPFAPGAIVKLEAPNFWVSGTPPASTEYRVYEARFTAFALNESSEDYTAPAADYDVNVSFALEAKDDPIFRIPPYTPPPPMLVVEGKIVSESGEDTDDTYQIYTDDKTKLNNYKIEIPLWASQKILAPYEPLLAPGHFYFPAYKHERVLVGMEFQKATILRFLDWREGAQLPADGQGDHLLLGKSTKSNTSLRHYYDSNKPVFLMLRTNDKDTGTLQIKEGNLMIQVKENTES